MKTSPNRRATIVGLFIFLGLVFLLAGILAIGDLHNTFVRKITVSTVFDDVNGLQAGNNIWFSGVKVGTVKQLTFSGKSQVKVTMKINEASQQYIRKDSKVKISTDGLIGNKIIVIYGGTSASPPIEDGDVLNIEKTFSTEDMMNTFQENNKNILAITTDFKAISKKIAAGEGTIGKLLNDEALFDNIQLAVTSLQQASTNAQQLTSSLSAYSKKLNQEGNFANSIATDTVLFKTISATVTQLQQIALNATELTANLKNATSDLDSSSNSPIGVLLHDKDAAANLQSTIAHLDSSSQKLNENLEALQHNFLLRKYFKKKENPK